MKPNRSKSLKGSKNLTIGEPKSFQHVYHVSFDTEDVSYTGLPAGWRKAVVRSATCLRGTSTVPSFKSLRRKKNTPREMLRRVRLPNGPGPEIAIDPPGLAASFAAPTVTAKNPIDIFKNVSAMQDFGSYSVLYGYRVENNRLYALKCINLDGALRVEELKRELGFLISHTHANIVRFVEAYIWDSSAMLVFLDDEDTTLSQLITTMSTSSTSPDQSSLQSRLTHPHVSFIIYYVLKGLEFMHSLKLIHRDLKSDNVLISSNGLIRISDFGACIKLEGLYMEGEVVGTPYYMAPEVAAKQPYNVEVDIWSCGCLLIEMFQICPPLYSYTPEEVVKILPTLDPTSIIPKNISSRFGPFVTPFLNYALAFKRTDRATASQLLIHPFLNVKCQPEVLAELHIKTSLI